MDVWFLVVVEHTRSRRQEGWGLTLAFWIDMRTTLCVMFVELLFHGR